MDVPAFHGAARPSEANNAPRFSANLSGAELRLQAFSFYSYPTSIFFNASYGFDRFSRFIKLQNATVTYGKEWRFYFGVLFGFDID